MIYAQAEDDFNRVETNYINAMGCLAEAEGESKIYQDLRMKLFIDPEAIKKDYAASPKRSEEHTSELQSRLHLVCRLLLEKKKINRTDPHVLSHQTTRADDPQQHASR